MSDVFCTSHCHQYSVFHLMSTTYHQFSRKSLCSIFCAFLQYCIVCIVNTIYNSIITIYNTVGGALWSVFKSILLWTQEHCTVQCAVCVHCNHYLQYIVLIQYLQYSIYNTVGGALSSAAQSCLQISPTHSSLLDSTVLNKIQNPLQKFNKSKFKR